MHYCTLDTKTGTRSCFKTCTVFDAVTYILMQLSLRGVSVSFFVFSVASLVQLFVKRFVPLTFFLQPKKS